MIAASEPLEFVPHGRRELVKHPRNLREPKHNQHDRSLLYKLTNFVIKDDSLFECKDEKETESWTVREVYQREYEEEDSQDESEAKETKDETSEPFRPQSRIKNEFNISIKSEIWTNNLKKMECDVNSRVASANSSSNMTNKFNLSGKGDGVRKKRRPNPKTDCCYEEELYVKGKTVIWSKGLISTPGTRITEPEYRETMICYTCESMIKHAAFCNFYVNINNSMLLDSLEAQIGDLRNYMKQEEQCNIKQEILPSICIIDDKCLRAFSNDGREYYTSLPFQVRKLWPMKYGLILEKEPTNIVHHSIFPSYLKYYDSMGSISKTRNFNISGRLRAESMTTIDADVQLPTCFFLGHPLDEMSPVLMKSACNGLQYYNDGDQQIIFVSPHPSIALIYDWKLNLHSLWRIRKATRDECISVCNMNTTNFDFSQSVNFGGSISNVSNFGKSNVKSSLLTQFGTPQTSKVHSTMHSKSRLHSPMANVLLQQGISPHTTLGQASTMSALGNTVNCSPPSLPIYPEICFDHIWTEVQSQKREQKSSNNAFLHTDQVHQDYLCYLVQAADDSRLHMLRLQKSHNAKVGKGNLIIGSSSVLQARDAVNLEHLRMLAIIDETRNIILYSGTAIIGKVHVGGVLARLITSPYNKRTTFNSPFPRRSSLLPNSRNTETVFDDSMLHLLSPVPHSSRDKDDSDMGLHGLCDPVSNRLTLEFDKGVYYRISLPDLTSCALVERCLNAIKTILQKDVSMQVIVKWYGVRNAPGTENLSPDQEWKMFITMLYSMLGYDVNKLYTAGDEIPSNEVVTKKQKTARNGQIEDWEYLLTSEFNKVYKTHLDTMLHLQETNDFIGDIPMETSTNILFNTSSVLFPYILHILYALHIVYEDIKLNTVLYGDLEHLSSFLYQISKDLRLDGYVCHYWKDFPGKYHLDIDPTESQIQECHLNKLTSPGFFTCEPVNVFGYLNSLLRCDEALGSYPYLCDVNCKSRDLVEIIGYILSGRLGSTTLISSNKYEGVNASSTPRSRDSLTTTNHTEIARNTVTLLADKGINLKDIEQMPSSISLILLSVIDICKENPHLDWSSDKYNLIMREDLSIQSNIGEILTSPEKYEEALKVEELYKETAFTEYKHKMQTDNKSEQEEFKTAMEHLDTKLLRLLYPTDHRMREVCSMLQSSVPITINLQQRHEVSDHDFIEEQEKYLHAINVRTTALPVARGMLTLRTRRDATTSINGTSTGVCVWGRGVRGERVEGAVPSIWCRFHAAVADGLAIAAPVSAADVMYHRQKGTPETLTEHAGFVFALGLNGHLKDMTSPIVYDYLVKCHVMTSIGFLLGLAATHRGTMDVQTTKMMAIHLEALLPPTSIDLDIHQNIIVTALMGLGLLYQGTVHMHYAEVLLNEIGKPPGPEMENSSEREGNALAAGLALGYIVCGAYATTPPRLANTLRHYMLGGAKRPLGGAQKEKFKQASFCVREGECVNVDVCGPSGCIALGLLYYNSNDKSIAEWLSPPQSHHLLDYVRPDLLMLRIIARGLILWNSIEPSEEWVESEVPAIVKPYCFVKPTETHIDYEAMNQVYCNVVAGACFSIGLRYSGSGDEDALDCLLHYANMMIKLMGKPIGELAGKSTLESCLNVILISAGLVMAGRGSIRVMRIVRMLRGRVSLCHGTQMALGMTLALLFISGGRGTIVANKETLPSLITAFFPKFPMHTNDNRYHLQAFRHLYVLAVEERLIIPRDIDTGRLTYANIEVLTVDSKVLTMKAPCLLPALDSIKEVRISDNRYWNVVFRKDRNWDILKKILKYSWAIDLKQRAGCLSHLDDPQNFLTLLAQTLTTDKSKIWSPTSENITSFTSDENMRNLASLFLMNKINSSEGSIDSVVLSEKYLIRDMSAACYECIIKDMICLIPVWTTYLKILKSLKTNPTSIGMWQLKLLLSFIENYNKNPIIESRTDILIPNEYILSILQNCTNIMDSWQARISPYIKQYLGIKQNIELSSEAMTMLSCFVIFYDLPRGILKDCSEQLNILKCVAELENFNLSVQAVSVIASILS